jgi:hypothetical protein
MMVALTGNRKQLIADLIDALVDDGIYYYSNSFGFGMTTSKENAYCDLALVSGFFDTAAIEPTFNVNSDLEFNGTSDSFGTGWHDGNGMATQNDIVYFARVGRNDKAAGNLATLVGKQAASGQPILMLRQETSGNLKFWVNTLTASVATGSNTAFTPNFYAIYRNGTTQGLYIDKTLNKSEVVASTGDVVTAMTLGAFNFNSSDTLWFDGTVKYWGTWRFTGFLIDTVYDNFEYVIAHWND